MNRSRICFRLTRFFGPLEESISSWSFTDSGSSFFGRLCLRRKVLWIIRRPRDTGIPVERDKNKKRENGILKARSCSILTDKWCIEVRACIQQSFQTLHLPLTGCDLHRGRLVLIIVNGTSPAPAEESESVNARHHTWFRASTSASFAIRKSIISDRSLWWRAAEWRSS